MPPSMTPRERTITALKGNMPDQIPFICYDDMLPEGADRERLHELGLAAFDRIEPYRIRYNRVTVETQHIQDGDYPAVLTTYQTPLGTLSQEHIVGPGYGSLWTKEWLIKRPEDYAIFEYIIRDGVYEDEIEDFLARDRAFGDNGLVVPRAADPPVQFAWRRYVGLERFFLDWHDRRDEVARVLDAFAEANQQIWPIVARTPSEFCASGSNISADTIGPALFNELVLPHFEAEAGVIGPTGKRTMNHLDGRIRVLRDAVAACPIDIIEALNPKPDGDISLAEARAAWPGKVLSINFPSSVHLSPPARIRDVTIDLLRQAAPGAGFVIGITENVPADRVVESFTTIAETLNQFGRCPIDPDALPETAETYA